MMALRLISQKQNIRIFDDFVYSLKDSYTAYESFLIQNGYSESSITAKLQAARRIHREHPFLLELQKCVEKDGVLTVGHCKGTAYLHFLCVIGLINISVTDYFKTNPKTINKLASWYEPYYKELGLTSYLRSVEDVINRTNNRSINAERVLKKVLTVCIYLIMHYHLQSIYDITQEEWFETIDAIKETTQRLANVMPHQIMGQAFFEEHIMDQSVTTYYRQQIENHMFDDMPLIKPIVERYTAYIDAIYEKETCNQKITAIRNFINYAKKKKSFKSLANVNRKLIYDYKVHILSLGHSSSYNQTQLYGVKNFLEFVESNKDELLKDGLKVPTKAIIINKDFSIKSTKYLPHPIDEDILNLMMNYLTEMGNTKFTLAFLLMLTTGICVADMMILKQDCLHQMADMSYTLTIYRKKKHKYYTVKARADAIKVIETLRKLNTQTVPMKHPDGTDAFFLLNDGGHTLTYSWFTKKFADMKKQIANDNPEIEDRILNATPHKLRHTFASRARDNGASITTLAKLLAHDNINSTKKYVMESDRIKQEYIDRLNAKYVCDAIDDITKLTGTQQGLQVISDMLNYKNDMSIGRCIVNGSENCPAAYQCVDCIYLCSTKEDVPEMMDMLKGLDSLYSDLVDQGRITEAEPYKTKMARLIGKINKLDELATEAELA